MANNDRKIGIRYNDNENQWEMAVCDDSFGACYWTTNYPIIYFPNSNDVKKIEFKIEEYKNSTPPVFNTDDPIWYDTGLTKPSMPPTGSDTSIYDIDPSNKKLKIKVKKDNPTGQIDTTYVLKFDGAPDLDPVIQNGGPPPYAGMVIDPPNGTSVAPGGESQATAGYGMGALLIVALITALIGGFLGYSMGKKGA